MGSNTASLLLKVGGDSTGGVGALNKTEAAMSKLESQTGRTNSALSKTAEISGRLGTGLSLGLSAPIFALGAASVSAAADYERLSKAISNNAKNSQEAARQMAALKEVAKLPGLGVEEAIKGSLTLQAYGLNAKTAETAVARFGNALALVGSGKGDLNETLRQFAQLAASGKLTQEALNPLVERVPQIAGILRKAFGSALADDLRKSGVTAAQVVDAISKGLGDLPKSVGGIQNSFDNLQDTFKETAVRLGNTLTPTIQKILPIVEDLAIEVGKAAEKFTTLDDTTQKWSLGLLGAAAVAGPLLKTVEGVGAGLRLAADASNLLAKGMAATGIVSFISSVGTAKFAIENGLVGALTAAESKFLAFGKAAAIVSRVSPYALLATGLGLILEPLTRTQTATENLNRAQKDKQATLERLSQQYAQNQGYVRTYSATVEEATTIVERFNQAGLKKPAAPVDLSKPYETLIDAMKAMGPAAEVPKVAIAAVGATANKHAQDLGIYELALKKVGLVYLDTGSLTDRLREQTDAFQQSVTRTFELLKQYGNVSNIVRAAGQRVVLEQPSIEGLDQLPGTGSLPTFAGTIGLPSIPIPVEAQIKLEPDPEADAKIKRQAEFTRQGLQYVSTAVSDVSRSIVDVISRSATLGEAFKKTFVSLGKGGMQILVEQGLKLGISKLGEMTGLVEKLGKGLSGVFGAATSGASTAASTLGGAGSQVGKAAGAIGSSATALVGVVAGVGTLISSVVGNFQMAGMNKTLGLIEESARYMKIWMGEQPQNMLYCLQKILENSGYLVGIGDEIGKILNRNGGAGGGTTYNFNFQLSFATAPAGGTAGAEKLSEDIMRRIIAQLPRR